MGFQTAEQAIAAGIAAGGDDEFEGMNCNDFLDDDDEQCLGWDGESRRCHCGNRRVYWETSKDSDGKFHAYGVAY